MDKLDTPWLDVQDAYMRAWEFRPTRAEPFYGIARHYSAAKRYRLGYLFAERAAQIPLPADDMVVHDPAIYAWRATDEQAVCASGIGKHPEAFNLCRRLLAAPTSPKMTETGLRPTATCRFRPCSKRPRRIQKRWCAALSTDHATPT